MTIEELKCKQSLTAACRAWLESVNYDIVIKESKAGGVIIKQRGAMGRNHMRIVLHACPICGTSALKRGQTSAEPPEEQQKHYEEYKNAVCKIVKG